MMQTIERSWAVRTAAAFLISSLFMAGCSGNGNVLPDRFGSNASFGTTEALATATDAGVRLPVLMRIRIPRANRNVRAIHPATISPLTQSVKIQINTGKPKVFNTTPSSPGCVATATGTMCTFVLGAKSGTDTFSVTTYTAAGGTGTALDRGVVKVPIKKGKKNAVTITLGPVVTTTADSGFGSLRYAVGSANSGDTIMFLLPAGSNIALATPISIAGNVTIAGPGASKLTISGGDAHQLFLIVGTATISGLTLSHAKAAVTSQPGGAIFNIGSLTLASDVIGSNTSLVGAIRRVHRETRASTIMARLHPHCTTTYAEGGALYNNGTAVISGTTFNGNVIQSNIPGCVTAEGGAIYNDQLGSLSSSGDTYSNNSAALGGAVYNNGFVQASFTGDNFSTNTGCTATSGCPTSGCNATTCTSSAVGEGAAIFDHGLGITVVNSTFTSNVAGGPTAHSAGLGGAIFLDTPSQLPTITGSTFTGNLAGGGTTSCSTGEGGAIVAANPIDLDNDTFKNNSATGDQTGAGGAVVAIAGLTGNNDTFSGNLATGSGGACTTNAEGLGGAVYAGGTVTIHGGSFASNSVSANGTGGAGAIGASGNVVVTNTTFTSNTATSTGAFGATSNTVAGGALYSTSIVKVTGDTFTSNGVSLSGTSPSTAAGGAIVSGTAIVSTSNTYASNTVTASAAGTAAGGGIITLSGTLVSSSDTFTANSVVNHNGVAAAGGAIVEGSACIVENDKFTSNSVSGTESIGGGFATGSACTIKNITLSGNKSTNTNPAMLGAGGGLFDTGGSTILDSKITGNTATNAGGGILSETNPTIVENSTVSGNVVTAASVANSGGGGIADTSGLELEQVTIANNTVTTGGPGPAGGGGIFDSSGVIMLNTTISGNKVLGSAPGGGGGIYSSNGILALNDTISDNSSSVDGGGLDLAGSATASFLQATIFKNVAAHNGGNANIPSGTGLSITNSILAGGIAATGADADNAGTLSSGDYNIIQTTPAGNAVSGTTTHNLAADPKLLPLANNGGPTFTHADQAHGVSPGTQYIAFSGTQCGTVTTQYDQRGFTRGAGGLCDVGSYEHAGVASAARHVHLPKMQSHAHRTSSRVHFPQLKPLKMVLPL